MSCWRCPCWATWSRCVLAVRTLCGGACATGLHGEALGADAGPADSCAHCVRSPLPQAALQRFDPGLDPAEAALPLTRMPGLGLPTPVPIPNLQR
jgi:hypothetical protein